jgi:hypothetical protein
MGMSASQARLLSITARITNNEFSSQTITNSKLRLAEKSEEASEEYMDALSSQQLMFGVYNDNGEYTTQELTPALLYEYSSLKNQYALTNNAGKILVSSEDAKNYENSNSLSEFLNCYGLIEDTIANDNYEKLLEEYNTQKAQYDDDKKQYDIDKAKYDTAYAEWLEQQNQTDLYAIFSDTVGTTDNPNAYCYEQALSGSSSCYLHLLNHLLDYDGQNIDWTDKKYTTTTGENLTNMNTALGGMDEAPELAEVSDGLNEVDENGNPTRLCDGDDDLNTDGKQNLLENLRNSGNEPTEIDYLKSDYLETDNGDGTYSYSLKSLKQKAVDLYYLIQNNLVTNKTEMKDLLVNYTDGDMKNLTIEPPDKPTEPIAPTPPEEPEYTISVNDKDKAQWYTNLWYYMNGSETANKISNKTMTYDNVEETIMTVEDCKKSSKGGNYEVFEDTSLFKSSEWLQFALEHGMVSMKQATYTDPSTDSYKVSTLTGDGYSWNSIIYTSATDITSQDDDVAIAIAEAKYKRTTTEIESQDKKYDQELKDLETEHSALQTEYDSIKEVISKNVDRSFKAFS